MHLSPTNKPKIFITMGDPSGIGPEVIAKAMANSLTENLAIFCILGDEDIISESLKKYYKGNISVHSFSGECEKIILKNDAVNIIDVDLGVKGFSPGKPTQEGAIKALKAIDVAIKLVKDGKDTDKKAIVTAPVNKAAIANISSGFIGHTEYLEEAFGVSGVAMVMVGKKFSVVPVTRHIPVREIANVLTKETLYKAIELIIENRSIISGKKMPSVGVAALNPHAGEEGKIGTEEIDIISPVVENLKKSYSTLTGPIPADTIFYQAYKGDFDIVISMYHDQCLAPFKMIEFDSGVNMTVGLPHVRTSPDHGTAYGIAGEGIANPESMINAIELAIRAVTNGN